MSNSSPSVPKSSVPIFSLVHTTQAKAPHDSNPITQAEILVQHALDNSESAGAFQWSKQIDLTKHVNPAAESHNVFDAADESIHRAVMDTREGNPKLESGDDEENACTAATVGRVPTRKEALQAALLLRKYVGYINNPYARELESMLGLFGQRMRAIEREARRGQDNQLSLS